MGGQSNGLEVMQECLPSTSLMDADRSDAIFREEGECAAAPELFERRKKAKMLSIEQESRSVFSSQHRTFVS